MKIEIVKNRSRYQIRLKNTKIHMLIIHQSLFASEQLPLITHLTIPLRHKQHICILISLFACWSLDLLQESFSHIISIIIPFLKIIERNLIISKLKNISTSIIINIFYSFVFLFEKKEVGL